MDKFYVRPREHGKEIDLMKRTADKNQKIATLYGIKEFNEFIRAITDNRAKIVMACEEGCLDEGNIKNENSD